MNLGNNFCLHKSFCTRRANEVRNFFEDHSGNGPYIHYLNSIVGTNNNYSNLLGEQIVNAILEESVFVCN